FSADGKNLVSACQDQTMVLWDVRTGKEIRQLPDTYPPSGLAVSADGAMMVADGMLLVRPMELATGKPLVSPEGHEGAIRSLSVSADGRTVATASLTALVWSLDAAKPARALPGYSTAALSPDGKTLASAGSQDYTLRLHDVATGRELHRFTAQHQGL